MKDLRTAPFFASLDDVIDRAVSFLQSESLMLVTTADLQSILALGFWSQPSSTERFPIPVESCPPIRIFLPMSRISSHHKMTKNILFIDAWNRFESSSENVLILASQPVEVEFHRSTTKRRIDVVLQASAIGSSFFTKWCSDTTLSAVFRLWTMDDGKPRYHDGSDSYNDSRFPSR